jgi:hypothetical protein
LNVLRKSVSGRHVNTVPSMFGLRTVLSIEAYARGQFDFVVDVCLKYGRYFLVQQ